ncbi:Mce-associated membrane protein [Rhodococcus sp. OK611]|nr:Mce-associated membrane protein [Rhodococcus sp. OK611]SNX90278.1 Mce-associated membrane protein [Rhodococcus sp. OK270]
MPPRRRTTSTPQPKGRRPRVAGTGSGTPRGPVSEPEATPPASSAATETEVVAVGPDVVSPPAGTPVAAAEATGDTEATAAVVADASGESAATEPEQAPKTINRTSSLRPRATGADADASSAPEAAVDGESVDEPVVDQEMVMAGWKRVTTIGLVALGLGVFALVAAFRPGADVPNQAWVDTSETSKVTADAKNAIQTLYTYKFDTVEQDFENARAVLDDAMREQFDKTAAVTKDAVIQTKTATNAEVTDIGLKLLSDDRAELVASMNVSATNDGAAQGSAQGPLSVTMAKSGDHWVITDIRDR